MLSLALAILAFRFLEVVPEGSWNPVPCPVEKTSFAMAGRQEPEPIDPDLNFQLLGPLLDRHEVDPLTFRKRADPLEDHQMEPVPQVIQDQPQDEGLSEPTPERHPSEGEGRSCLELLQFGPGSMTASRKRPLEAIAEDLDGWIATQIGECSGWVGLHPQSCSKPYLTCHP